MEPTEERRVLRLPVAEIRPNPRQPRRFFDERGLRELATSIRRHGIIQPLTVRRAPQGWELVAGERRLRAAKLAGLETVPCIEAAVDDRESALLALVENLQRRDLHYFEEATAIADYLRQSGVTQEEAAALLGRSPSAVANKLRLLRLSPACREILVRNRLSERHARCRWRTSRSGWPRPGTWHKRNSTWPRQNSTSSGGWPLCSPSPPPDGERLFLRMSGCFSTVWTGVCG